MAQGPPTRYNLDMDKDKYYEGLLLKQSGHPLEALEAFEAAVDGTPESALAWNEMGLLFDDDGRAAAAARAYEKAISLDPGYAKAWNNWGVTAFVQQDWVVAKERFSRALALDPQLESARLNLEDVDDQLRDNED